MTKKVKFSFKIEHSTTKERETEFSDLDLIIEIVGEKNPKASKINFVEGKKQIERFAKAFSDPSVSIKKEDEDEDYMGKFYVKGNNLKIHNFKFYSCFTNTEDKIDIGFTYKPDGKPTTIPTKILDSSAISKLNDFLKQCKDEGEAIKVLQVIHNHLSNEKEQNKFAEFVNKSEDLQGFIKELGEEHKEEPAEDKEPVIEDEKKPKEEIIDDTKKGGGKPVEIVRHKPETEPINFINEDGIDPRLLILNEEETIDYFTEDEEESDGDHEKPKEEHKEELEEKPIRGTIKTKGKSTDDTTGTEKKPKEKQVKLKKEGKGKKESDWSASMTINLAGKGEKQPPRTSQVKSSVITKSPEKPYLNILETNSENIKTNSFLPETEMQNEINDIIEDQNGEKAEKFIRTHNIYSAVVDKLSKDEDTKQNQRPILKNIAQNYFVRGKIQATLSKKDGHGNKLELYEEIKDSIEEAPEVITKDSFVKKVVEEFAKEEINHIDTREDKKPSFVLEARVEVNGNGTKDLILEGGDLPYNPGSIRFTIPTENALNDLVELIREVGIQEVIEEALRKDPNSVKILDNNEKLKKISEKWPTKLQNFFSKSRDMSTKGQNEQVQSH